MSAWIERAMEILRETAPDGFFVGGGVRDWLLGRPMKDLDIAVPAGVESIGRRAADRLGGVFFWLRHEMNVARVLVRGDDPVQIDVVPLAGSLEQDLRRRDFTINAMAVSARCGLVEGVAVVDPTGGLVDLAARRLRLAAPDALERDPLRCLRAFRLRAVLGLTFDPSLEPALHAAGPGLKQISGERIRDEFFVLLEGEKTALVMSDLLAHALIESWSPALADSAAGSPPRDRNSKERIPSGVAVVGELDRWLAAAAPELPAAEDLTAALETEVTPPRRGRALVRLAALSIGAGGGVDAIPRSLCLSAEEARVVKRAVQGCHVIREAVPRAGHERLRFFQRWEPGSVEAALLAIAVQQQSNRNVWPGLADLAAGTGASPATVQPLMELLAELLERRLRPVPPLLTGEEVMAILRLAPGPEVGRYLQEVEERRADGSLSTSEQAREWLRERRE
jgi:tRNA nucleotidyltransferase/poly(A) polymerase